MKAKSKALLIIGIVIILVSTIAIHFRFRSDNKSSNLRIGVLLSLTGDSAAYGKRSLNGLTLATEQINAAGGINGRPIELMVEDAQSSPKEAVTAFRKLTDVDGVRIVIGDVLSGTTLAVAPIAEAHKDILFAPGASNPALRDAGDYIFRNWSSDTFDGQCMARYLEKAGVKQIGILLENTDYTVGVANALANDFEKGHGNVADREEFGSDSSDLRSQLTKLKGSGVNSIYVASYSLGTGRALRQATELGLKVHWYSTLTVDSPECEKIAGAAREGVIFTTPAFNVDDPSSEMVTFVADYRSKFGEAPEVVAGHAFDAMNILALVLKKSGDDVESVKKGLYSVANFPGVTGLTTFDNHGDVTKGVYVKQIKEGATVTLEYMKPALDGVNGGK